MPRNNTKFDFCEIRNSSDGSDRAELLFYGDIVSDSWGAFQNEDQYPDNIKNLIADIGDRDVDIRINSGGGAVFAGNAICNILRSLHGKKTVYIDGIAASIASIIAMAGDEIIMPENALLMIHKPVVSYFFSSMNADALRKDAELLDRCEDSMIATYMTRTKPDVTEDALKNMLRAETWMNATQAAEVFSTVKITEPVTAAASAPIKSKFFDSYHNLPQQFKAASASEPKPESLPFTDMPNMDEYEAYLEMCSALYDNYI